MSVQGSYRDLLESKFAFQSVSGFDVDPALINPQLKPHIRGLIPWGLKGGRRAFFLDFGLAKTSLQIELMRLISARTGGPTLIVLPLGVRQEFFNDAAKLFKGEHSVRLEFIRDAGQIEQGPHPIYLTNYETVRDGKLDPSLFVAASLDEAACLRDYGSKTYQAFLPLFVKVPYRFVCTATPAPNRLKELIHYSAFLGVLDSGDALTRFFQRDSEKANNLTLYPHREDEFWLWVHSWAAFLQKPSDLGYSDAGYDLPEMRVHWHEVPSDHAAAGADRDGQGLLLANPASGLQEAAAEKRSSLAARVERLLSIVGATDAGEQWVLWCDLNAEQAAIERGLGALGRSVTSLTGSQEIEDRELELGRWKGREKQDFLSKPSMYGAGANLQQACRMAFVGVGYQFHDFIQGVHRCFRFGQSRPVEVHIIHSEAERPIVAELKRKWREHVEMRDRMAAIIREHGLDHTAAKERLRRTIGVKRVEARGERWMAWNNDTVLESRLIPDASVGQIVTSPPFGNQYEYVSAYEDFGHCSSMDTFWRQMDFLTPELFRILWPGRLACIHVKDRILFGNVTGQGVPTVLPFHAQAIFHCLKHGFQFMGMITVVTDVVRENNQTYRLGYTEMCKDGTKMGVGSPEYILLMRKPQSDRSRGYADMPVVKDPAKYSLARWQLDAHAFWRSSGNRLLTADELIALGPQKMAGYFPKWTVHAGPYDYEQHVAMGEAIETRRPGALPRTFMGLAPGSADPGVWHDVNRMLTLNGHQVRRNVELHVCPLQFDIVDRLIERYSNPGELVFDPFLGLGTVPYRALLKGRHGAGVELHPGYFADACRYLRAAEQQASAPDLFGIPDEKEAA
jgi:hypothetical protein